MTTEFEKETRSGTKTDESYKPSILVLIAISTISPLSMNIYLPSMAGMVGDFGTTSAMVQLTISLFLVSIAVSQIFIGPLSDRFGRRPLVLWGMGLYIAATIACLFAPTIEILIATRIVQAIGGSSGMTLSRAIVRDVYQRDKAASMIGYVTMGMAVGPMLAPAFGGVLDGIFGWKGSFYTMAVLGLFSFTAAYFNLRETNLSPSSANGLKSLGSNMWRLMHEPMFWIYSLIVALASALYFSYLGGAPFISANLLHIAPAEMGLYFMFVAAGYILGNFISGRISERVGIFPMIGTGSVIPIFAVGAVMLVVIAGVYHPVALFLPMFFVGLGNGICIPSAVSGAVSVKPELAGAASGLVGSLQVGFGAVSSALVAWMLSATMWPMSVWPMLAVMAFCAVSALALAITARVLER